LTDAVKVFLGTITVCNTRRGYAAALDRLVCDFGADTDVAGLDPDRVSGWFVFVWGAKSSKMFNLRLMALSSACGYWHEQGWLVGDPVAWLRARPVPPDNSRALSSVEVTELLRTRWGTCAEMGTLHAGCCAVISRPCPGCGRSRNWLWRTFDDSPGQSASSTRVRSRSKLARPYMVRLIILIRLTLPSTAPLLHSRLSPLRTAS
jgi:hypothetical protein